MANLDNLDVVELANKGEVLEIIHPTTGAVLTDEGEKAGDPKNIKNWFVKLLGSDSDTYRNAIKRNFERAQGNKNKKLDIDEAKRKAAELLAKCTTDCYIIEGDSAIKFSKDEMVRLYLKYPFLREQCEEFMADRGNFIKS
jgi:hypothetical protein